MSNAFDFQATNVALALDVLFPTNVYPGSGIGINKQGPSWTINLDVASLPENTSATPPSNFYFPAWDTGTQLNEKVRLDNMIAAATGLDTRKAIGDANYNILTTDRYVAIASALTANRLITLPPANSVPGGREVLIQDEIGTLGPTHYVTIQPTGADTIDGTQARVLGIPYAGLRVRSDGVGRWSYVNAFAVTKIADANYTANPDDRVIDMTALTAARVVTLPAAIAYPAGQRFTLYDQAGQCSATNTLRLAPAGADLINGSASPAIATLVAPYAYIGVISDGVSRWTVVDGGNVTAGTTILSTQISDSSPLGRSLLTQTTAALDRTSLGSTAVGDALFTAASQAAAQSTLGLGTMAVENSNAVSISGGSINGVSVGSVTPGVGTFTTLTANGAVTANGANAAISLAPTGTGAVTINPATAGHIDNMIIGATTPAAATVTSMNGGQLAGMRNKIINGDFRIDQRYAGSGASAVVGSTYFCDRWGVWSSQAGHQNGAGAQFGAGVGYYGLLSTVSAFVTPGASDYIFIGQRIEGLNVADLLWGSAPAQAVTLSGLINSPLSGNLAIAVRNTAGTSSYVTTVPVTAATWVRFSVSIPGPTTGTWPSDNTAAIDVSFVAGCGTTFQAASANAWLSGNFLTVAGALNLMSQTSGVLYFKDIQLEPGSVATPFERRPIGTELALCQRYYQHYTSTAQYGVQIVGYTTAGQNVLASLPIPPMRATPSGSFIGTWINNNTTGPLFAIANGSTGNIVMYATATALGVVVTYSPANGGYDLSAEL